MITQQLIEFFQKLFLKNPDDLCSTLAQLIELDYEVITFALLHNKQTLIESKLRKPEKGF
jgi:hypothetical protein